MFAALTCGACVYPLQLVVAEERAGCGQEGAARRYPAAIAGGAGSSTSDQESSFYSTDSDAYASGADGGFYSSGEES